MRIFESPVQLDRLLNSLPFSSEHSRRTHANTIKGALLRAIRLCSNVEDFDSERLQIELTYY